MKKEVILAIVLGLFFGLLITFGLYRTNSQKSTTTPSTTPTPTPSSAANISKLTIIEPLEGAVLATSTATLRGSITSGSHLLIMDESTEYFVKPDTNSMFSQVISLDPGTNLIDIYLFDETNEIDHQQLNLVFSTSI